jgi:hypothetical protein
MRELSPFLPVALGLAVGVLVWAITCALARRRRAPRDDGTVSR